MFFTKIKKKKQNPKPSQLKQLMYLLLLCLIVTLPWPASVWEVAGLEQQLLPQSL